MIRYIGAGSADNAIGRCLFSEIARALPTLD